MFGRSRINIYEYLYNLFHGVVTENVYSMNEPQELTNSDTKDGFIVIHVGDMHDESEFNGHAYGWARCFVEAFIPPITRGRLNYDLYKTFEDGINSVITSAVEEDSGSYYIQEDGIISTDVEEVSNANNAYFTYVKSFIVGYDNEEQLSLSYGNVYIGFADSELGGFNDVFDLDTLSDIYRINGVHELSIEDGKYLWICTQESIDGVTSRGTVIPMEEPVDIKDYHCYRSSNAFTGETVRIEIAAPNAEGQKPKISVGELYIGTFGDSIQKKSDVFLFSDLQEYDRPSAAGDYSVTFSEVSYLWICTTSRIDYVSSSGFEVPMLQPFVVDNLYCYRSANSIVAGEMNIRIR